MNAGNRQRPLHPHEEARTPHATTLLADSDDSRVERIETSAGPLLRKTYTTSPFLLWRTLLRRSRSQREARNLLTLELSGIPVVEALDWSEMRALFCVVRSTLTTRFLPESVDLRETLRNETSGELRRACARRLGQLLRQIHAAGLASTTLSPRNILVSRRDREIELRVCDQPFLARLGRGVGMSWLQHVDLYDAFFSPNRLREWSSPERWRGMLEYCGGDRDLTRALWRKITHRRRWSIRVAREGSRLLAHFRKTASSPQR